MSSSTAGREDRSQPTGQLVCASQDKKKGKPILQEVGGCVESPGEVPDFQGGQQPPNTARLLQGDHPQTTQARGKQPMSWAMQRTIS